MHFETRKLPRLTKVFFFFNDPPPTETSPLPLHAALPISQPCPAPPPPTPITSHSVPGRKPNCAASTGPTSGPAPAIAAKWCPNNTHLFVGTKSRPLLNRSAGVARRSSSPNTRLARNLL